MAEKYLNLVSSAIDDKKEYLNEISQEIWKTPELGYNENFAHDKLTSALENLGFNVTKRYLLHTAFKAEFCLSKGGPTIVIILEYDALPGIGHACGHNLIAEAGLAAGFAVKAAMQKDNIKGTLLLLGTPAEEGGGGKIQMMDSEALKGVDAALMVHPSKFTSFTPPMFSHVRVSVEFQGRAAHASGFPWEGINALDAAVATYSNLSMLRQQMKPTTRVHAIITKGGSATNVIPEESAMMIGVRADNIEDSDALLSSVKDCIEAGAKAAKCTFTIKVHEENWYKSLVTNKVMASQFEKHARTLGLEPSVIPSCVPVGSSDMGNVSQAVPSIHPFYDINTEAINHSKDFTEASGFDASA